MGSTFRELKLIIIDKIVLKKNIRKCRAVLDYNQSGYFKVGRQSGLGGSQREYFNDVKSFDNLKKVALMLFHPLFVGINDLLLVNVTSLRRSHFERGSISNLTNFDVRERSGTDTGIIPGE